MEVWEVGSESVGVEPSNYVVGWLSEHLLVTIVQASDVTLRFIWMSTGGTNVLHLGLATPNH